MSVCVCVHACMCACVHACVHVYMIKEQCTQITLWNSSSLALLRDLRRGQMDQSPAAAALRLAVNKHALIRAVRTGDTKTVANLLDRGIPIDTKDDEGNSLLHWAAEGGHVTTMRLLTRRGCNVDSVDGRGLTPLHWAAAMGQTKAVRELIRKGATKSMVAGVYGPPLHLAAFRGHVEAVETMLAEGCPFDAVDNDGQTVLHWAAKGGHVEVVRKLIDRGCDVNAVKANGCTSLHGAANCGNTEAVRELIRCGATKSVVAGMYGTPLHQAVAKGYVETVKVLLENIICEDQFCETELTNHDAIPSKTELSQCSVIGTCNSFGQTPVMWAVRYGQVEVFKLLTSKGGTITDRDTHSLSAFEQCFVGGHASKLSQFCEACDIRSSGEGLRGALATLITKGLVDAHKVLCLCAICGDSVFLEDKFSALVASDACAMPAAVKCAKYYFHKGEGVPFINKLCIPNENAPMSLLHIALLSLKCFEMGFAGPTVQKGVKNHTSFITKLLSHPVFRKTVNENFRNGLSLLDLARQFELPDIAALIEWSGGRPGVWADIPHEIEVKHPLALPQLKEAYAYIKAIADDGEYGQEFIKRVFSSILGGQPVYSVGYAADDSQLVKEQVLGQRPDLGDVVTHVLPHIQVRHWKRVGLALGMKKSALDDLGQQFPNDDDRYLETLSHWLEHGSSVTWKTLLDVLGLSEVECTMVELRGKIVSELGGAHQVSVQCCVLSEGAVWCAACVVCGILEASVLLSCVFVLFCLLFSSFLLLLPSNPISSSVSLFCFHFGLRSLPSWPAPQGPFCTLRGQQS